MAGAVETECWDGKGANSGWHLNGLEQNEEQGVSAVFWRNRSMQGDTVVKGLEVAACLDQVHRT